MFRGAVTLTLCYIQKNAEKLLTTEEGAVPMLQDHVQPIGERPQSQSFYFFLKK